MDKKLHLNPKRLSADVELLAQKQGWGEALAQLAEGNKQIVGLSADVSSSTGMDYFANAFPERFANVGVAEQNLVAVASGMAAMGKLPFVSAYAAFSPGRNWEQIRTTICINNSNVKLVGTHTGFSDSPDGATHQALEDIVLMRALPNMSVVVPCDNIEAGKAVKELLGSPSPAYLRISREKTPVITSAKTPFKLGVAQVFKSGTDVSIVACGPLVHQALLAARDLEPKGISAEVINCAVVKPLDTQTILESVRKTGAVVTVEEGQAAGGLGGAIAELLGANQPVPLQRIGVTDRFGESGTVEQLWEHFGLSAPHITKAVQEVIGVKQNG